MNKKLSSTASTKMSLEAIRNGEAGLNEKQKILLFMVLIGIAILMKNYLIYCKRRN